MKQGALVEGRKSMEACTPTSRPNRSLVMIDSISINIDAAVQSKSEKCEHFTIRGFVSDSRTRNGAHCWPLSVDGNKDINSRPHMDVPKFRRWQCQSCLGEIDTVVNTTVNCSRLLKTNYRFHRSLENVVTYLSKKSAKHPELVCARCKGTESATEFTPKQHVASGLGENKLRSADGDFISKQHACTESNNQIVTLTNVDEHQKQCLRSTLTTSIKVSIADAAKHSGRLAAGMNHDDSGSTGRRRPKKVRLLDDLFDKDRKVDQPALTRGFPANKAAKVSHNGLGQKRNRKCHEQDSGHSQMHNADSSDGKGEMTRAQDINSSLADAETHMVSKDASSSAFIKQADKMLFGSNQGADVQKNNYHRGQQRNFDLCRKQVCMSTSQAFHGRATDPRQNNMAPSSQFKGISNDNMLNSADNSKEIDGNSVPKNPPMEKVQIGQHTQSVQDDRSIKSQYHFSDGCLDTRKGNRYYVPQSENGNLRDDFTMQYMGESRSVGRSLVDKNMWQQIKSDSGLKRPNQVPCIGNKKQKYNSRTEGLTVVHQTEFLFGTGNKRVVGSQESPEHSKKIMPEVGTSDDIPMEIVELMAKNQYERRLHEAGDSYYMPQLGSNPKHDVVGSASVLSNVVSAAVQNQKSYLPSNISNAGAISEKGSGIPNKRPNGNMFQRTTGSTHCPALLSQRDLSSGFQTPFSGSSKPDLFRNCKFDMNNFPPKHRVSPRSQASYEEWRPASRQSDKTAHVWPVIPPNNSVHMPDACQGSVLHPFDVGKVPTSSSYVVEGRGHHNLYLADFGHTTNGFRPEASSASRPDRVNSRPQMSVSPIPYSNETLTAMHLLSLMDGRQSGTVTNMEVNANRKTFDRSFSNDHLAKELSVNSLGADKANHKFKKPSPYGCQSNDIHSGASYKCSPPVPRFGSVVTSLPGDIGNKKDTLSHLQERTYVNRTIDGSLLADENNGYKSQTSRLASVSGVKGQLVPARELSNHISSPMWFGSGSSHSHMNGNNSGYCNLVPAESYHTLKRRAETGACYVNRNPMDFTTPGPGNEYMIGTEELKFRNRILNPYITGPIATNTLKQHRFTTYTTPSKRL